MRDAPPPDVPGDSALVPGLARPAAALMSLHDAAAYLRVSERTVRRQVRAKRLHCVRIGRRLLFDPADVSRFVAARKE